MAIVALAQAATGCMRSNNTAQVDPADAAVTFQSALATPATWQNLWGSWPFARYYHSMVYDADRKVMVLFGGQAGTNGPYYDDTWEWDGARGGWNEKTPAPNGTMTSTSSPPPRTQQMMVYDTVQKKAFMFSGWQPQATIYAPDMWEWDGTTWKERIIAGAQPNPRYSGTLVWDSDRNRAVLFGGFCQTPSSGAAARCNDVWEWDGTGTGTWTNRTPAAGAMQPSPRMYHHAAYDAGRKKMVVFGGYTGTGPATTGTWVDETWEWDGSGAGAGAWTKVTPAAGNSIAYYSSDIQLVYDAGRGVVVAYYYIGQMWEYDPVTPKWNPITTTKASTSDPDTPPYSYGQLVYDPVRAQIVAFGGYSGSTRDLWELDGTTKTWVNRSVPTNGPIQRSAPSVAYDTKRGKVMLFGGYSSVNNLYNQDIWEWSGTDSSWTPRANLNTKPPGRQSGQMVYDSNRDQLLLWGGSGTGVTNDLWSWSPTTRNWTLVPIAAGTAAAPGNTSTASMFYDPKRDKLQLWINYYTNYEFDIATSTWTNRYDSKNLPPSAFTARSYYEVTYDTDRSKMLFVLGLSGGSPSVWDADVWEWDAATNVFTERAPPAAGPNPPGRYQHGVSYDSARRVVVLFGGYGEAAPVTSMQLNDSWEWDGIAGTWTETTPGGVRPLPRVNPIQIFDSLKSTTLVFGGSVSADSTYGPQEIWEYLANTSPRPNGSGCSAASASTCASGNCVDGVCCMQTALQCAGTCQACNVPGKLGVCSAVPAGLPDDTCPTDQACDANSQCKQKPGHICNSYADCASGHCADGVCCNTDCNGTCMQCNLNNSLGTCAQVPTNNEDPGTCTSDPIQARYCDASGVCQNKAKPNGSACTASGQCMSTYCVDGYCCSSACATACYSCGLASSPGTCAAIPAGQQDHSATTPCDASNQYCSGGACQMNKKPNGALCPNGNADCGSGYCVDGTCCNSTCVGTCQGCNVPGSEGSCVNVLAGAQDPNSSPTCTGAQYCDGKGTCQSGLKANGVICAAGTECGSGNCVDGVCCDSACDGSCSACNLAGRVGTCSGVTTGNTDVSAGAGKTCVAPNYCKADRTCTSGLKPNGASCTVGGECGSSNCVDKTCCESQCSGTCNTCANATGSCMPVPAGMDPRNNCNGSFVCGGKCDGQGSCAWAPNGKLCANSGCQPTGQITMSDSHCDGAGNCTPDAKPKDCMGFGCYTDTSNMAQCKTSCATDPDCQIKFYCQMGGDGGVDGGSQCPPQLPLGSACTRDTQCLSGTCAIPRNATSGVCCNTQCSTCGSCDATGQCQPYAAGTDPNGDCMDNQSDPTHQCGGKCDGHAHCSYALAGTTCGKCKACDGAGLCDKTPDDDTMCGPIDCDMLTTSCRVYQDITSKRCGGFGTCKQANSVGTCTVFTDSCPTDGGTGTGGSTGPGTGGGGGSAGGSSGGGAGRGGSTGTGGASTTGTAGAAGNKDGGAGAGGGGGGGCCSVGGSDMPTSLGTLLVLACVMIARRRRR